MPVRDVEESVRGPAGGEQTGRPRWCMPGCHRARSAKAEHAEKFAHGRAIEPPAPAGSGVDRRDNRKPGRAMHHLLLHGEPADPTDGQPAEP
jgi:hypothetical protein